MSQERRQHIRTAFDGLVKLMHPSIGELEVNDFFDATKDVIFLDSFFDIKTTIK